jgi:hypothetical protein
MSLNSELRTTDVTVILLLWNIRGNTVGATVVPALDITTLYVPINTVRPMTSRTLNFPQRPTRTSWRFITTLVAITVVGGRLITRPAIRRYVLRVSGAYRFNTLCVHVAVAKPRSSDTGDDKVHGKGETHSDWYSFCWVTDEEVLLLLPIMVLCLMPASLYSTILTFDISFNKFRAVFQLVLTVPCYDIKS